MERSSQSASVAARNLIRAISRIKLRYLRLLPSVFERLPSTQDMVNELASTGSPEGTMILAWEQTAGHGREGRAWFSPRGGIWMSLVLRPRLSGRQLPYLSLASSLAVAETLASDFGIKARVKLPNDILVGSRKIAGVLVDADVQADRVNYVVIGIGLNVNISRGSFPKQVSGSATSMMRVLRKRTKLQEVLVRLLHRLDSAILDLLEEGEDTFERKIKDYM